uniref:Uncharacterized protein n=1 Tax=Glossina brevipalpis TaxID=37001 RepID=A0A1A9WHA4_9MUSC
MVNEINQPKEISENAQLEQRLIASSHALLEMQTEHNQLMQDMERLRERAEELQRMRLQQTSQQQSSSSQLSAKMQTTVTVTETKGEAIAEESEESIKSKENDEEDASEAEYITQKLNEIALLKAQLKKVQNLVSTTDMIEKHLAQQSTSTSSLHKETVSEESHVTTSYECATSSKSRSLLTTIATSSTSDSQVSNEINDDKCQLLNTMVDMFQDLSGDLKEEADTLRAERERIKTLKEDILRQREQSKK